MNQLYWEKLLCKVRQRKTLSNAQTISEKIIKIINKEKN